MGQITTNSLVGTLHRIRPTLELVTCCVGELATVRRNGAPWPLVYGLAVNVKTGDIFPAQFTDKGPDMDLRSARYSPSHMYHNCARKGRIRKGKN